jgi:uncharacterized membrane protein
VRVVATSIFTDEHRAAEVWATLRRRRARGRLPFDEAAYVVRDGSGRLTLCEEEVLTLGGAPAGDLWESLIGLLEVGAGRAGSVLARALADRVAQRLRPRTSAVLALVWPPDLDRVLQALGAFGGVVVHAPLSAAAEARLRATRREHDGAVDGGA